MNLDQDQDLAVHQSHSRSRLAAAMPRSCCRHPCREPGDPNTPLTLPPLSSSSAGELRASLTLHISGFTDEVAMNSSSAQESAWRDEPALKIFTTVYRVSIIYSTENRHRWHFSSSPQASALCHSEDWVCKILFFSQNIYLPSLVNS